MFSSPKLSWLDMSIHCSRGICIFQKEIETVDEPITWFSSDASHSLLVLRVYHHTTLFLFGNFTSFISHFPFPIIRFLFSFPLLLPKSFFLYFMHFFDLASLFFHSFFFAWTSRVIFALPLVCWEVIVTAWVFDWWRIAILVSSSCWLLGVRGIPIGISSSFEAHCW